MIILLCKQSDILITLIIKVLFSLYFKNINYYKILELFQIFLIMRIYLLVDQINYAV
jgi:hypothetical protein